MPNVTPKPKNVPNVAKNMKDQPTESVKLSTSARMETNSVNSAKPTTKDVLPALPDMKSKKKTEPVLPKLIALKMKRTVSNVLKTKPNVPNVPTVSGLKVNSVKNVPPHVLPVKMPPNVNLAQKNNT